MADHEVSVIKFGRFKELASAHVLMIVRDGCKYRVEQWSPDGIAPTSNYPTPETAAARVLQLLRIKDSVAPQDHPEICGLSDIDTQVPVLRPKPEDAT